MHSLQPSAVGGGAGVPGSVGGGAGAVTVLTARAATPAAAVAAAAAATPLATQPSQQQQQGQQQPPTQAQHALHHHTVNVGTQQVINYSKAGGGVGALGTVVGVVGPVGGGPGTLQYAGAALQRHKVPMGNQSPGAPVQVSISQGSSGQVTVTGPGGPPQGPNTQFQRLKVEDALYYLDQVKYKFNNQPQVYNDFLDIMKEFKSQSIDTPGVITRVSNLFKNHPELIVGFNTFLPPGYKIEVQANDQGYAFQVSVSVPSPTSCAIAGSQHAVHAAHVAHAAHTQHSSHSHSQSHVVQILPQGAGGGAIVHNLSVASSTTIQSGPQLLSGGAQPPVVCVPPPPTPAPPSVPPLGNTLHNLSAAHHQLEQHPQQLASSQHNAPQSHPLAATAQPSQPVEFNHAIEYVNKIKNRFSRQPDKYKKFLEILHGYQRCQRELKEPQVKQTEQEVYAQVAKLFENQDDLLAEFGQFLPDATGGAASGGARAPSSPAAAASAPVGVGPLLPAVSLGGGVTSITATSVAPSREGRPPTAPLQQRPAMLEQTVPTPETSPADGYSVPVAPVNTNTALESHHHNQNRRRAITPPPVGQHIHHKRSPSLSSTHGPPAKKPRPLPVPAVAAAPPITPAHHPGLYAPRDVSFAEATKYGSISDFGFFDRIRKALKSQEVYDNFLRCLLLYTSEIVSKTELLAVTAPFLVRHPELQRRLQDFLGVTSAPSPPPTPTQPTPAVASLTALATTPTGLSTPPAVGNGPQYLATHHQITLPGAHPGFGVRNEPLGAAGAHYRYERPQGDAAMEIDLSTCKRLGASYCALPRTSADAAWRRSSGRTPLCRDVLNDTWVSFPAWSEDSTFVTSRKTIYEEYIYRCEDERFELDVVIETNASCIRCLEGVAKRLSRMNGEEAARYRLDDCLGGTSATVHRRALRRIYGDKASDIIAGLKKNPVVAVPVVLRRLKAKEEEWREAQKGFNKQWREQNEKYYLKSLDHQGINFKQNDLKAIRSKSLFNEIETIYEERRKSGGEGIPHIVSSHGCGGTTAVTVLRDAADLLLHHARRQAAVQRAEKRRVKRLLRQFVPSLFSQPQQPLSDDDDVDDDKEGSDGGNDSSGPSSPASPGYEPPKKLIQAKTDNSIKQEKTEGSSESDSNTWEKNSRRRNSVNINSQHNSTASKDIKRSTDSPPKLETDSKVKKEEERNVPPEHSSEAVNGGDQTPVTFFCGGSWYAFLRLHALLCSRLAALHSLTEKLAAEERSDTPVGDSPNSASAAAALRLRPSRAPAASQRYTAMLDLVRALLDGNAEPGGYEDALRDMFGIHAYPAFTLDKVVGAAVRQLQYAGARRAADRLLSRSLREGTSTRYEGRARRALARHDQPAFKVKVYSGDEWKVSFELLETSEGGTAASPHNASNAAGGPQDTATNNHLLHGPGGVNQMSEWSRYQEQYSISSKRPPEGIEGCIERKPVFLRRNVRGCSASEMSLSCEEPESPGATAGGAAGAMVLSVGRGGRRKQPPRRVSHEDCTEAALGPNSVRLAYINSSSRDHILYRHGSFARAKQKLSRVSERLSERWRRRQEAWASRNAPHAPATLAALMPAPSQAATAAAR